VLAKTYTVFGVVERENLPTSTEKVMALELMVMDDVPEGMTLVPTTLTE
jgi:hypothetical protein